MTLLDDQFREINLHVRHVAQLVVTWYAFFVTANLLAIGWFITTDTSKVKIDRSIVWTAVALFLAVNILGLLALHVARRYVAAENGRVQAFLSLQAAEAELLSRSPIPARLYTRAIVLMSVSLVAIFSTWLALGILRK